MAKEITATFQDGKTITYKGDRNVTAAWAIRDGVDGKILLTGFSLDAEKARKTANSNVRMVSKETGFETPASAGLLTKEWAKHLMSALKESGYWNGDKKSTTKREVFNAARAKHSEVMAANREKITIEVARAK